MQKNRFQAKISTENVISEVFGEIQWDLKMFNFFEKSHQFRSQFPNYCRKTNFKQRFWLKTLFLRFLVKFSEIWKLSVFSQIIVNLGLYSRIIAENPISSKDFDWKPYFRGFWWNSVRFKKWSVLSQNLVNLGLNSRIIAEKPISSKDFDWKPYFRGFWWISVRFENVQFFHK